MRVSGEAQRWVRSQCRLPATSPPPRPRTATTATGGRTSRIVNDCAERRSSSAPACGRATGHGPSMSHTFARAPGEEAVAEHGPHRAARGWVELRTSNLVTTCSSVAMTGKEHCLQVRAGLSPRRGKIRMAVLLDWRLPQANTVTHWAARRNAGVVHRDRAYAAAKDALWAEGQTAHARRRTARDSCGRVRLGKAVGHASSRPLGPAAQGKRGAAWRAGPDSARWARGQRGPCCARQGRPRARVWVRGRGRWRWVGGSCDFSNSTRSSVPPLLLRPCGRTSHRGADRRGPGLPTWRPWGLHSSSGWPSATWHGAGPGRRLRRQKLEQRIHTGFSRLRRGAAPWIQ